MFFQNPIKKSNLEHSFSFKQHNMNWNIEFSYVIQMGRKESSPTSSKILILRVRISLMHTKLIKAGYKTILLILAISLYMQEGIAKVRSGKHFVCNY